MSLLFDISPSEPEKQKTRKARAAEIPPARDLSEFANPENAPIYIGNTDYLGRLDDGVICIDQTCQATAHDIVEEGMAEIGESRRLRPAWLVECCFCGTGQWVPVIKGHLKPKEEAFRLRDGRFAGMTFDEAAAAPRGSDYIAWAATEHPRKAVREAAKSWLASKQAGG